nr:Tic22-like protein [Ipomoea batatas]
MAAASPEKIQARHSINHLSYFFQSTASNLHSLINANTPSSFPSPRPGTPILFSESTPHPPPLLHSSPFESADSNSSCPTPSSAINGMSSRSGSGFPAPVRISGLSSGGKGGPAFVGQVFSMCDLAGTGLMTVSTHFDVPFLSKRTPEWLKKTFAAVTKSEKNGPVFCFFMDLGDAVSYVKRLNIPSGVVGACRLDVAYEHFKKKPHLFQFVPNEKQVKEANKLLNTMPRNGRRKRVDGVPVFSARNLDIAIATKDGVKWYTPYFFDKSMLDNILEDSVDQHFHSLIRRRHFQRRRGVMDDDIGNIAADLVEEMDNSIWEPPEEQKLDNIWEPPEEQKLDSIWQSPEEQKSDSIWDPPELQEAMNEIFPDFPLMSAISKVAEIKLLDAVDEVVLGNRWLRKAIGVQPKFPYMVDSFERRSAASLQRACKSSNIDAISESDTQLKCIGSSADKMDSVPDKRRLDLHFPFSDSFSLPWLNQQQRQNNITDKKEVKGNDPYPSAFLPKITMVGVSMGVPGQMNKSTLKKTMEDLTKELERNDQRNLAGNSNDTLICEERDPLFLANIGDHLKTVQRKFFASQF